ncbi:MAG: HDOD domain-containing protein [Desulfobacteraceae bacterium]|nr:HDOD domain-containing protein [Desulfobacteraceae bacterium]
MNDIIKKIKKSARSLTIPKTYFQLKALLDEPDYTLAEAALLAGREPGLAVRFLKIANSAFYRKQSEIETISHAVSTLDSRQVHDIMLCASVWQAFKQIPYSVMDMGKFWRRCVFCAVTIQQLAIRCEQMDTERFFLIGLLHDIGHLFMHLSIAGKTQTAILQANETQSPLYQVQRDLLGFDYAKISGIVMQEWGLPKSLRIPITFHPEPTNADHFKLETALLHLAHLLVQSHLENSFFGEGGFIIDPVVWKYSGLTQEDCLQARQTAAKTSGSIADSIFN